MKYTDESFMGRESDRPDTPRDEVPPLPGARLAPNPLDGIERPTGWRSEALVQVNAVSRIYAGLPKRPPLWTLETGFARQRIAARVAMEAVRTDRDPEFAVAAALRAFEAAKLIPDEEPAPAAVAAGAPEHDEEF